MRRLINNPEEFFRSLFSPPFSLISEKSELNRCARASIRI